MEKQAISNQTLKRLPIYLNYLKALPQDSAVNISATTIAEGLRLNEVQVRKDLASVSSGGRPRVGYAKGHLIHDLERFLGYDDATSAILVGAGNLGKALLSYHGFAQRGLNIVAAFDERVCEEGIEIDGKQVLPMAKLEEMLARMKILIGIITVPDYAAQQVCDRLVAGGVRAIWNFAPTHLTVPEKVLLQNESMVSSLAVLSKRLSEQLDQEEE
ncbi:MAG: redox-sensing transcriptional repressor Rex [Clostridia bacterium]